MAALAPAPRADDVLVAVDVPAVVQPPAEEAQAPSAAAEPSADAPAQEPPARCCAWKGLPLAPVRAPLQMFCALAVATTLALAPQCALAFKGKGVWIGASCLPCRASSPVVRL